jgi:hypothetical protein
VSEIDGWKEEKDGRLVEMAGIEEEYSTLKERSVLSLSRVADALSNACSLSLSCSSLILPPCPPVRRDTPSGYINSD